MDILTHIVGVPYKHFPPDKPLMSCTECLCRIRLHVVVLSPPFHDFERFEKCFKSSLWFSSIIHLYDCGSHNNYKINNGCGLITNNNGCGLITNNKRCIS